ncbi:MAG: 16S rRNA (cytidine(1402)-2'-O)-methyltransferase [Verrucomicrobiota bacterium]
MSSVAERGVLYVVATPIGNLDDLSQRARDILSSVGSIACEDTRVTGNLLAKLGIPKPRLVSYRDENEKTVSEKLLSSIEEGTSLALVSDAGTPTISDPGFRLVRACRVVGIPVRSIPGPSAAVAALAVSGLPSDRFFFVGFLPPKSAARRQFFTSYADFSHTLIFYESVHRIEKFLSELIEVLGEDRTISVARELTKKYESSFSGKATVVKDQVLSQSRKGEYVVIVATKGFDL